MNFVQGTPLKSVDVSGSQTRKLLVGNIGASMTVEKISRFFHLDQEDYVQSGAGVELSEANGNHMALLHVPGELFNDILAMNRT